LRLFSFGGYGLALAVLALVVFGAYDSYPDRQPVYFILAIHSLELSVLVPYKAFFGIFFSLKRAQLALYK